MNVKLLRKVQKFLRAEPRRFDMSDWVQNAKHADVLEPPPYGIACCIAGAAAILVNKVTLRKAFILRQEDGYTFLMRGIDALGLNACQEDQLCYTSNWPPKFKQAYDSAETPLQRVQAGIARIDHFIKTKGKE